MMNMGITDAVKQLLIINVLFYVCTLIVGQPAFDILALYFPENGNFQFWQPLTYMFMHSVNPMHILFNMLALYSFGVLLERLWGTKKFIFFYISCGLGAAALHIAISYFSFNQGMEILTSNGFSRESIIQLLSQQKMDTRWEELLTSSQLSDLISSYAVPTVGASGAIYGLLVAFAFLAPNAELMLMFIPVPIKAKYFVPGILALDLFLGLKGQSIFGTSTGIAHFAHIGGALIGFIMMWYWKKNSFNNNRWN